MAQDWLAEVRRGGDPGGAKAEACKASTVEALCNKFIEDYSKKRNKPSAQRGYQAVLDRCLIPLIDCKNAQNVKRPDIAGLMSATHDCLRRTMLAMIPGNSARATGARCGNPKPSGADAVLTHQVKSALGPVEAWMLNTASSLDADTVSFTERSSI